MRYRKMTPEEIREVEEFAPWLKEANFEDATIQLSPYGMNWMDGVWKTG